MWRRLVASKYGEDHFDWKSRKPKGATGGSLWQGICKWNDDFFKHVGYKVNNGERVNFWHDVWCNREPFVNRFPDHYVIAGCNGDQFEII